MIAILPFRPIPIRFSQLEAPNGYLDDYVESHALWYYYLCARQTWENVTRDPMAYEGELDSGANYRQLFESIARLYCVDPEHMVKCWLQVDKQAELLNLPKLPNEERYRFCVQTNIVLLS